MKRAKLLTLLFISLCACEAPNEVKTPYGTVEVVESTKIYGCVCKIEFRNQQHETLTNYYWFACPCNSTVNSRVTLKFE